MKTYLKPIIQTHFDSNNARDMEIREQLQIEWDLMNHATSS